MGSVLSDFWRRERDRKAANRTHNPMMMDWELCFEKVYGFKNRTVIIDGFENRTAIIKAFADFFENTNKKKLDIHGKCVLGGYVYGRYGFDDGDMIITSDIESIERIERGDCDGVSHDLMCATTASGSKYYFYSDEHSYHMSQLLEEMLRYGRIDVDSYPMKYSPSIVFGPEFI